MGDENRLDILVSIRGQLDDLVKATSEIKKLRTEAASTTREVKSGFGSLFGNMTAAGLASNVISKVASATLGMVTSSVREANQAFESSRNLEISVLGYQRLRAVIRQSGGDVTALNQAIERLNSSMVDARDPAKDVAGYFRALGINSLQLEAVPVERRFILLARAANNSADRLAAWDLVGKIIGDKTLPRLREGLNQLAEDGFDSVADSATAAEATGVEAIHNLYESVEQNSAVLKSKFVEDFGGLLTGFGFGGTKGSSAGQGLSSVDVAKLNSISKQKAAVEELKLALGNLNEQNAFMVDDPRYTDAQKKFWVNAAASQAITLLDALAKIRREMPLDIANGDTMAKRTAELAALELRIKALQQSISTPASAFSGIQSGFENTQVRPSGTGVGNANFLSVGEGMQAGPMQWVTELGSAGQQVAATLHDTLGTAVDGIGNGIYGWVTRTKSFGAAMAQVGGSILQSVIKAIIQIGAQMLVNSILGTAIHNKEKLETKESMGGLALKAGLKALSQLGPIYGTIAFILALAGIYALTKGFATGGYTGDGGRGEVAGVVHGQEYVLNAGATARLGTGFLDEVNAGQPVASAAAAFGGSGGSYAGGGARESARNIYVLFDRQTFSRAMQEDSTGYFHEILASAMRS